MGTMNFACSTPPQQLAYSFSSKITLNFFQILNIISAFQSSSQKSENTPLEDTHKRTAAPIPGGRT
jgi:hypothetical protein